MSRAVAIAAVSVLSIVTLLRVASTHRLFSQTFDEPIHVAAGHEYLAEHKYTLDREHPPLARITFAWPFRDVVRTKEDWVERGIELYRSTGDYMRGLARSRRGNLLFVLLAICAVYFWARERLGHTAAVTASALFAMLPPVLAHGGLTTTDMAGAAAFPLAMLALYRWLDRPSWPRTIALGLAIGTGLVSKFSFPLFFAVAAIVVMIARRRCPVVKGFVAHLLALAVVWGVYQFQFDQMENADPGAPEMARKVFGTPRVATGLHVPAPMFFVGLMNVKIHDQTGHPAYFMGEVREHGWWYYFPVVLAIKTPIPFLILFIAGAAFAIRRRIHQELVVMALAMLAVTMTSRINLGVRHLLPLYAPMALLAAYGLAEWWRTRAKWAAAGATAWLVVNSATAHPDYIPWMNALAGRHPERIVLDSNFDWGQDVLRLRDECRKRGITELGTFLFGTTDQTMIGLPSPHGIDPFRGSPGWYAVSESAIIPAQARDETAYKWLTAHGFYRVGKTIRLYHVTDEY